MDSDDDRRRRAAQRRRIATLRKGTLSPSEAELHPVSGVEAISLLTRLSEESWSLAGLPQPTYTRPHTPYRFVDRSR